MKKNAFVGVTALIVLVGSMFYIGGFRGFFLTQPMVHQNRDVYWYDLKEGKYFGHPPTLEVVMAPSGTEAVRAYVFACHDCSDPNDRYVAYLERITPEARNVLYKEVADGNPMGRTMAMGHALIRREHDTEWLQTTFPDARKLVGESFTKCDGQPALTCYYPE
jgi:hypothetical protein